MGAIVTGRLLGNRERSLKCSITYEENSLQWELKSPAHIEGFKERFDLRKIVRSAIGVAHGNRKVENIVHHASLKDVLEELIVIDGPSRFNLEHPARFGVVRISVEALQHFPLSSKEHRDNYLLLTRLAPLDTESEFFETRPQERHNGVAVLVAAGS